MVRIYPQTHHPIFITQLGLCCVSSCGINLALGINWHLSLSGGIVFCCLEVGFLGERRWGCAITCAPSASDEHNLLHGSVEEHGEVCASNCGCFSKFRRRRPIQHGSPPNNVWKSNKGVNYKVQIFVQKQRLSLQQWWWYWFKFFF